MKFSGTRMQNRRKNVRREYREPVQYHIVHSDEMGGCVGHDISQGGIQIELNQFLPIDTEIKLDFSLEHIAPFVSQLARVVWAAGVPHCDRYKIGCKFEAPCEEIH
jgi:c-di-GMP-binding flagellar brake protein YcgR